MLVWTGQHIEAWGEKQWHTLVAHKSCDVGVTLRMVNGPEKKTKTNMTLKYKLNASWDKLNKELAAGILTFPQWCAGFLPPCWRTHAHVSCKHWEALQARPPYTHTSINRIFKTSFLVFSHSLCVQLKPTVAAVQWDPPWGASCRALPAERAPPSAATAGEAASWGSQRTGQTRCEPRDKPHVECTRTDTCTRTLLEMRLVQFFHIVLQRFHFYVNCTLWLMMRMAPLSLN